MSACDRMELIKEIEGLAAEIGAGDLPLIQKLEDRSDNFLVNLRTVLSIRTEELFGAAVGA